MSVVHACVRIDHSAKRVEVHGCFQLKRICLQFGTTHNMTDSIYTTTSSDNITDDEDLERQTFHIYILSFTYGLMVVGWHSTFACMHTPYSHQCCMICCIYLEITYFATYFVLVAGGNRSLGLEMAVEKEKFVTV